MKNIMRFMLAIAAAITYRSKLYYRQFQSFFRKIIRRKKTNKVVIYTALFGGYDALRDQPIEIKNCDFVCFTDDVNLQSSTYDVRVVSPLSECSNRSAKIFKILPHKFFPEYEYSIWVDGSITFQTDVVNELIDQYLGESNLAAFKHAKRECIYDELEVCISLGKDKPSLMTTQVEGYRIQGYPEKLGLAACGVLIRRHNEEDVKAFSQRWFDEIQNGSRRDQLSFNYSAWKTDFRFKYIDKDISDNEYFYNSKHQRTGAPGGNFFSRLRDKL